MTADWLVGGVKRPRILILACLAALCGLAWLYLLSGAGMGSEAEPTLAHQHGAGMEMDMSGMIGGPPPMTVTSFATALAMWWIMMIAMMLPSAAPAILLYDRVRCQAFANRADVLPADTSLFVAGYLLIWLAFSAAAALAQILLSAQGLLSPMLSLHGRLLAAAVLILAGLYQLTPLKSACLAHCRSPASYFARHWRPGASGALRLGMKHGSYCLGCCWLLMLLLFIGGVMNMVWILVLTLFVLAEKILPWGPTVGRISGVALIVCGLVYLWI